MLINLASMIKGSLWPILTLFHTYKILTFPPLCTAYHSPKMTQMKVLMSGAGIAGNSLTFWLSKLGHKVTVVERFHFLRTSGLQIDVRSHGIEVLKRMGLENTFRSHAVPGLGIQMVYSSGTRRAYFPANRSGTEAQSFTSEFEIMRGIFVGFCMMLRKIVWSMCSGFLLRN